MVKSLNPSCLIQEQDKNDHSQCCYLTLYWNSEPQQSDKKKETQIEREEVKLFANNMILCIEHTKIST